MDHEIVETAKKPLEGLSAKTDEWWEAKWAREKREDLWLLTMACASIRGSRDASKLAEFADRVLKEFDTRFRQQQQKPRRPKDQKARENGREHHAPSYLPESGQANP